MNKEIVLKLINSDMWDDNLLGLEYLSRESKEFILSLGDQCDSQTHGNMTEEGARIRMGKSLRKYTHKYLTINDEILFFPGQHYLTIRLKSVYYNNSFPIVNIKDL